MRIDFLQVIYIIKLISFNLAAFCLCGCEGKPEKVRTASCFLEREMALRNWRKTGTVVFSGLFFFGYFLLEEQKKVTII
jgi:hypothetical protein